MKLSRNDLVEGKIIDFSHEGNGVMKVDNFTVFVKGGLIGDHVKVKIEEAKKSYAVGVVKEILEASVDRVENPMDIKESRGGIPLVDYKYEKQLEWKTNKVKMDLERIGGLEDVKINNIIEMEDPFRYRNHVQVAVGEDMGKIEIGFYEMNSNDIVDMDKSILQDEQADRIIAIIREWIEEFNIRPYDKKSGKGLLRYIGIRTNKDKEAMVILVTVKDKIYNKDILLERLKEENVVSIYQNINNLKSSVTYGRQYKKLYGKNALVDYIGEFKFNISPNSFFQVNRIQAEVLYGKAIEYLDLDKEDIVFDLYSGIGTTSLHIANKVKKVYGVEVVKAAIEDARNNAKLNNVDNTEFILGQAEVIFPKMMEQEMEASKLVIDPPRKGCDKEVLESIIDLSPERLVYISCNPATLARDAKYLVENGYKIVEVQPVDMFPHTAHVECIALIQREIS